MFPRSVLILSIGAVALFTSCRKDKEEDAPSPSTDITAASDNYKAESYFADALKQADKAYKDGEGGCIQSVTIDLSVMPHTMVVDFGTENCVGADGLARRGKLNVTFTGPYSDPGTVVTITPDGFHVNDHLLQGTKTITNAGQNDQGQTYFTVVVDGTVTAPDGSWTSSHDYQRTRTWIEGESTAQIIDDVYLITGGGNGINRNGLPFTLNITIPLRVELDCPWIVSGVQEVTPQGLTTRIINFGDGTCDSTVSISVGNFTFNIG
jgi:hypothetical protein